MTTNVVRYFAVLFTFLVAIGLGNVVAGAAREGRLAVPKPEVSNRDKTGTSPTPENDNGSQVAKIKPNASRGSFEAEGMGFEPTTPFGALDFESSRWPIRLPSR